METLHDSLEDFKLKHLTEDLVNDISKGWIFGLFSLITGLRKSRLNKLGILLHRKPEDIGKLFKLIERINKTSAQKDQSSQRISRAVLKATSMGRNVNQPNSMSQLIFFANTADRQLWIIREKKFRQKLK